MRPTRHTDGMDGYYMASGTYVTPLDLQPDQVIYRDVVHHLSNLCRFNGGSTPFYSVAEHSIRVSRLLAPDPALELWGLMHDASEAYLGDWPRPLKHNSYIGTLYRAAEARAMLAIADALDLPLMADGWHDRIKQADNIMLATEKRDLCPNLRDVEWDVLDGVEPLPERILHPFQPWEAYQQFQRTYERLIRQLGEQEEAA